jgi:DNA replication protein DnaC
VFFFVADLLDYMRHLKSDHTGPRFLEGFYQLRNAPLLILDDLGAQSDVAWVRDRLFQLINHRYNARLPTVFTVSEESLERHVEERVLSRLNDPGVCTEVPITAPAYRADLKNRPASLNKAPSRAAHEPQRRRTTRR